MDERGGSLVSFDVPGVVFGMPTWSPDGSRIAAVGSSADDAAVYVFRAPAADRGGPAKPIAVYRSSDSPPFYLYWTPDGRKVAFLATDADGLALRIAPADGSAPLDGSGAGAIIRRGAPLYFDWEGADRLLLHVGSGSSAFVGEVGLDGERAPRTLPGTGSFRAAGASRDGRFVAFVRAGQDPTGGEIVVAARDGTGPHGLPAFGPAAFNFDPTGDLLAAVAADRPVANPPPFPLGPLRLLDPRSGDARTLLDGAVVAFFWSPDGRTIAALRLVDGGGNQALEAPATFVAARTVRVGSAVPAVPIGAGRVPAPAEALFAAASPPPGVEVRLVFVDVASGAIRSDRPVRLGSEFVNALLPYFDQYALSHRVWAPDSSALLLPLVDASGGSRLVVLPADGGADRPIAPGVSGFWSP